MNTLVIHDSKFGNTARLAGVIAERLGAAGPVRLASVEAAPFDFADVDLLVIGGPTQLHGIRPPLRALFEQLPRGTLDNVLAAAFDTRMPGRALFTGAAARNIGHWLKRMGARVVVPPESFLVTGREGPLADGEWERAQTWADQVLAQAEAYLPALAH